MKTNGLKENRAWGWDDCDIALEDFSKVDTFHKNNEDDKYWYWSAKENSTINSIFSGWSDLNKDNKGKIR